MDVISKTPIFWVILVQNRQIWPPGVYTNVVDWYLYWIHFIRIVFELVWNGFLGMFGICQGVKIVKNCFFSLFSTNILAFNPPMVFRERVTPGLFVLFSKKFYTFFKINFDFRWFFMIILDRKPKNVQNLAKMRKFKFFFSIFKTPRG